MKNSESNYNKAVEILAGGINSPVRAFKSVGGQPFYSKSANGPYLQTVDNNQLIDFVCSWGAIIHGHNNSEIKQAIKETLENGISFGTPHEKEIEIAQLIQKHYPSMQKIRMVNSGTEATMSAIRLARGFTNRTKILKFSGCYHGHADSFLIKAGSGAMTLGYPDSKGIPESFAQETVIIPFNDELALEKAFEEYGNQLACVIVEPYPANCGLILPKINFLKNLSNLCNKEHVLFILDEVITGFRVGLGGAQALEGITPDLTTLGKIIGGGLPAAAFGGRSEIMDLLAPNGPVYQAGTLSGNPICLSAGIAAIKLLESNTFIYSKMEQQIESLKDVLLSVAKTKGIPLQFSHKKTLFSLFFADHVIDNYESALTTSKNIFKKVFHQCLENGLFLPPSPFECCFLTTAHTDIVMESATAILVKAIKEL